MARDVHVQAEGLWPVVLLLSDTQAEEQTVSTALWALKNCPQSHSSVDLLSLLRNLKAPEAA